MRWECYEKKKTNENTVFAKVTCWREKVRRQGWSRLWRTKISSQKRRHWADEAIRAKLCCCRSSRYSPTSSSFSSCCWNPWTDWIGLLPSPHLVTYGLVSDIHAAREQIDCSLSQCQAPVMLKNDSSANICTNYYFVYWNLEWYWVKSHVQKHEPKISRLGIQCLQDKNLCGMLIRNNLSPSRLALANYFVYRWTHQAELSSIIHHSLFIHYSFPQNTIKSGCRSPLWKRSP